jgi:hypothetical protein
LRIPRTGKYNLDAIMNHANDNQPAARATTTQTVRIAGKRVRLVTKDGKVVVKAAPALEWELQAAQVRALRKMPNILFVGGMEAGKRGPRAQAMALATGLTAGHPDLTIFLPGGRCAFIENKVGNPVTGSGGRLSPAQVARHAALRALGHTVEVIRATTPEDAAAQAVSLVTGWLAGNDNRAENNSAKCDKVA